MEIQSQLLNLLSTTDHPIDGSVFDTTELVRVLNGLSSREIVAFEPMVSESWVLTDEGADILSKGSHEAQVFYAIPKGQSMPIPQLVIFEAKSLGETIRFYCKVWAGCSV